MEAPAIDIRNALRLAFASAGQVTRVRCVLRSAGLFLLVRHRSWQKRHAKKWALPGGRVKRGEDPTSALRRELAEELEVCLPHFQTLMDCEQGGEIHRLYGCDIEGALVSIDTDEIADARWFTHRQVVELARAGRLHRGFELAAIEKYALEDRRRCTQQ